MSVEFVLRLIGMVVLAIVGWQLGVSLVREVGGSSAEQVRTVLILSLSGAALGILLTPWFTTKPFRWVRDRIRGMSTQHLVAIVFGLVLGLIIGALLSIPLSNLPEPWGNILPIAFTLFFVWLAISVTVVRARDIDMLLRSRRAGNVSLEEPVVVKNERMILLDSSVIIDGRIADIAQTGFIQVPLVVPRFVLNEVQYIADSSDDMRRVRGRRGLEVLNRMRKNSPTPIRILDMDVDDVSNVDDKLIMLARQLHCPVMTNDFNLNRVAEIQGVQVLNINELANAVKAIYLPGETFTVRIIQQGKDPSQGVGYLDDGTMVVVQNGVRFIDHTVEVEVSRVIQTAAGRMIFAEILSS